MYENKSSRANVRILSHRRVPFTVRRPAGRLYLSVPGQSVCQRPDRQYRAAQCQPDGWQLERVLHYLVPLCAFALGVLTAEKMQERFREMRTLHWRQLVVLGEGLLLFLVGFLPQEQNLLANAIVSFACAMQVQAFRKVNGYAFASTMCIGDLRSGVEALCIWCRTHEPRAMDRMLRYFGIILLFAIGAGIGSRSTALLGGRAIWFCCGFLLVSFALMFIREDLEENPVIEKDLTEIRQETREISQALKQELQEEHRELKESTEPRKE